MIELYILFHIVCAVLVYGFSFAYCQGKWHAIAKSQYHLDMTMCLSPSPLGPIWLVLCALITGTEGFKYGLKFW